MPITITEEVATHVVTVTMSGKLTDADYQHFIPQIEEVIGRLGSVRLVADMHELPGWTLGAAWDDLKFGTRHAKDISRLAVVGEKRWQEWMTKVCAVFMKAPVRYFESDQLDTAVSWVKKLE